MKESLGILIALTIVTSCSRTDLSGSSVNREEGYVLCVSANSQTKTTINGNVINWSLNDKIGLHIKDRHNNIALINLDPENLNNFQGVLPLNGLPSGTTQYYAYYPFCPGAEGDKISSTLPANQKWPFDPNANFMFAQSITSRYDEENMPDLSFVFGTQLFGIIKIRIRNVDEQYRNECLRRIELISTEGKTLSGDFSFSIYDPLNSFSFSSVPARTSASVCSVLDEPRAIGYNETIEAYLFVPPVRLDGFMVRIQTDNLVAQIETSSEVTVERGDLVNIPMIDFGAHGKLQSLKKIACWGDSYTHGDSTYTIPLQNALGCKWHVFDGGISGDTPIEIAARQGAIKSYVKNSFILPAALSSINISGIMVEQNELTMTEKPFRNNRWGESTRLLNPCIIAGVECTLTNTSIKRLHPGDAVSVPEGAEIQTYGSRYCRDADVIVIYMGENGAFNNDWNLLVKQHQAMIDYATSKQYIVLAFHQKKPVGYLDTMDSAFGEHVLHLMPAVNVRAEELLLKTGAYLSVEDIPEEEMERISAGYWPWVFCSSKTDSHPSEFGSRAMAILVHDKMIKLGYLDDDYILDDPSDL